MKATSFSRLELAMACGIHNALVLCAQPRDIQKCQSALEDTKVRKIFKGNGQGEAMYHPLMRYMLLTCANGTNVGAKEARNDTL